MVREENGWGGGGANGGSVGVFLTYGEYGLRYDFSSEEFVLFWEGVRNLRRALYVALIQGSEMLAGLHCKNLV